MPQAPELGLPKPFPNAYKTEQGLTASLARKGTARPGTGLYPRDGSASVTDVEEAISQLTIPGQEFNVVVSSGMAAINGALEFALTERGKELGEPPKLVHAIEGYSQSLASFRSLKYMGVRVEGADTGNDSIEKVVAEKEPDVLFAETVANTPAMPVFHVHDMLRISRTIQAYNGEGLIMVWDNTPLLSTGQNFADILTPDDRVLIVESATKGPMHNSDHLGVVYSKNPDLMEAFRKFKATKGMVTSAGADRGILRTIEATTPGFHERNRALMASTGKIAVGLAEAAELSQNDTAQGFTVTFPGLEDHPDHEYAVEHLRDGISPVVFMACKGFDPELARQLLIRVSEHPRMREQIKEGQIFLGQSFGFDTARLLYDRHAPYVRVAGGYNIDSDALAGALKEAAADV